MAGRSFGQTSTMWRCLIWTSFMTRYFELTHCRIKTDAKIKRNFFSLWSWRILHCEQENLDSEGKSPSLPCPPPPHLITVKYHIVCIACVSGAWNYFSSNTLSYYPIMRFKSGDASLSPSYISRGLFILRMSAIFGDFC